MRYKMRYKMYKMSALSFSNTFRSLLVTTGIFLPFNEVFVIILHLVLIVNDNRKTKWARASRKSTTLSMHVNDI